MSAIRSGLGALGLALDIASAAAWGVAAFFLIGNLVSTSAGGLLGLAVFFSILAYMLNARMQDSRAQALMLDACPRCKASMRREHEHRRWDIEGQRWLAPLTTWECGACDYTHAEPAPCERCPEAA